MGPSSTSCLARNLFRCLQTCWVLCLNVKGSGGGAHHLPPIACLPLSAARPSSSLGAPRSWEDHQRLLKGAKHGSLQMLALLRRHRVSDGSLWAARLSQKSHRK